MARKQPIIRPRKAKTIDKDLGFRDILKQLRKLEDKPFVKAGFPAEFRPFAKSKTSTTNEGQEVEVSKTATVLDAAIFNEFGTSRIPERSFIRSAFDKNRAKYEKTTKKLLVKIYKSEISVERALDILGLMLETDIKDMIKNGKYEPLSIFTILKKGSEKPLIDTGQMINSVRFKRIMKGFNRKR